MHAIYADQLTPQTTPTDRHIYPWSLGNAPEFFHDLLKNQALTGSKGQTPQKRPRESLSCESDLGVPTWIMTDLAQVN